MDINKDYEATTFNMNIDLKTKAKMYVAQHNQLVRNGEDGEKTNLGKLLNEALRYYLSDIKIEGVNE